MGLGDSNDRSTFEEVTLMKNERIISILGGWAHCVALTGLYFYSNLFKFKLHQEKGEIYSWGNNGNGQLGIGTTNKELIPCKVSIEESIISIACGDNHTIALSSNLFLKYFKYLK